MEKDTERLLHDIKASSNIEEYLAKNADECIEMDLAQYLEKLLIKKNLERKHVFERGNIAQSYGDQILVGRKEKPSRDIILKFCFGLCLNIDESQHLLRVARLGALYARDKRDSVIIFCLENQKTAVECDLLFDELNMMTLTCKKI